MREYFNRILFICFLFIFPAIGYPQINEGSIPLYKIPKIKDVIFDGKLEENFWEDLDNFQFIQYQPSYSLNTSEKISAYLVYDQKYLYLAGRLYVSNPEFIRQQSYKRDASNASTDYFGMVLDTYNDKENGVAFFTSPTGFRYDAAVSNDMSTESSLSESWNTYWDVLTSVTDQYYDVEIRIPWSSLKFEPKNGKVRMGISIWRYLAAKNEMNLFPNINPELGEMANWKPSLFQEIIFEGIQSSNPVYITPFILLGNQRENFLNDEESNFDYTSNFNYNAGLDIKYNLTSNLTLDLTVNTDFAQVESDDQQINLTRHKLFRPEKRQFFQERSSLFDFMFNRVNHLFYSRKIGIEEEEVVPILGGARLTGKIGDVDIGVINMQTAKANSRFLEGFSRDHLSNNFSVLRMKKQVLNPYSYLGGMLTNKMNFKGDFNTSYGLDGVFRLWGDEYLTIKWAQTFGDSIDNNPFSLDPSRIYFGMEKRRFSGFSYNFDISSTGKSYNPEMGFVSRDNYMTGSCYFNYGYIFNDQSFWQNLSAFSGLWADYKYELDKIDQASIFGGLRFQAKNSWSFRLSLKYNYDILTEALSLSDEVEVPIGTYRYKKIFFKVGTPYNSRLGLEFDFDLGEFFDGQIKSFALEPRWNPNAHLEMKAAYEFNHINFQTREDVLISHILRIRALYMLNSRFSVSAFLQYNNASSLFISNLKLRYNPREGNDLYIVFNEVLNGDRERMIPNYPLLNTEVFALKYTYTFKWN